MIRYLSYRLLGTMQVILFFTLFSSVAIQVTDLHGELFEVLELESLEIESDSDDENELDEDLFALMFLEKEYYLIPKARGFETVYGYAENRWVSPHLEVPELPPLNS